MGMTYIQFEVSKSESQPSKDGLLTSSFKKAIVSILTSIIPKANPDFDDKIDKVRYWLLECDSGSGIPEREIGIDDQGRVILKMPYRNNYGYWTDNNLTLNDFKTTFATSEISRESFDKEWELFDKLSDFELEISDYRMSSTGADGGHIYLTSEINYQGAKRKLIIYFADKADEQKLKSTGIIKLSGRLFDYGINQSLSLLDTKLLHQK